MDHTRELIDNGAASQYMADLLNVPLDTLSGLERLTAERKNVDHGGAAGCR
jgi:hypothetical protein